MFEFESQSALSVDMQEEHFKTTRILGIKAVVDCFTLYGFVLIWQIPHLITFLEHGGAY